jgi:hypothetical protein
MPILPRSQKALRRVSLPRRPTATIPRFPRSLQYRKFLTHQGLPAYTSSWSVFRVWVAVSNCSDRDGDRVDLWDRVEFCCAWRYDKIAAQSEPLAGSSLAGRARRARDGVCAGCDWRPVFVLLLRACLKTIVACCPQSARRPGGAVAFDVVRADRATKSTSLPGS